MRFQRATQEAFDALPIGKQCNTDNGLLPPIGSKVYVNTQSPKSKQKWVIARAVSGYHWRTPDNRYMYCGMYNEWFKR